MDKKQLGRLLRIFTPFILLLIGLIFLNYQFEDSFTSQPSLVPTNSPNNKEPTATETKSSTNKNSGPEPIATAIANATAMPTFSPEATPEPTSTMLPKDIVTLTGPPEQSRIPLTSPLTFYWFSDMVLSEGEAFNLYVVNDTGEILVGSLSKPNLGSAYQVSFIAETSGLSAADYDWIVKVIDLESDALLGESERRGITLFDTNQ